MSYVRRQHRANEASLLVLSTDAPMQDEKPNRNTHNRNCSREEQSRRPDTAGFRQGSQVRAGYPRGDSLALFGLCVQEYEALLVFAEELGYRDVLDGVVADPVPSSWAVMVSRGIVTGAVLPARSSAQVPPAWMWFMCFMPVLEGSASVA